MTHPKIAILNKIPQNQQKSKEWLEQRKKYLTSSDAGTALGLNPYQNPVELLFSKCGAGKPFDGNEATRWGEKYEDEAIEMYCNSMGMVQHEFGLIPAEMVVREEGDLFFPGSEFLAGSPDGIATKIESPNDGEAFLLEVKCPMRRKIKMGYCPAYYYPQVQLNMYICNVKNAAFIEYKPSPVLDNIQLNVVHYTRDDKWLAENIPVLRTFWDQVLYYRKVGIDKHPEYLKYAWTPERINKLREKEAESARKKENSKPKFMLSDD
tara:strand:+ start:6686 stop:7480 length:795 start_codon:yes stop_codon:yes gene_type:complete